MIRLPAATRVVFRAALSLSLPPVLLAAAIAFAFADPTTFGADAPATLAPWLHLPAFTAAAACGITALQCWPTFAQHRHGADWVLRLRSGPCYGCAHAAFGALLALAVWLLPIGLVAALLMPTPHAHHALTADSSPILDAGHPCVTFPADGSNYQELRLRPFAFLPASEPQPTSLEVLADNLPLSTQPLRITGTRELLPIHFALRTIHTLSVRRTTGNLPLFFAADGAVLIAAANSSRILNGIIAAYWHLLPLAVALALAMLCAPFAALPVNIMVFVTALLVQTLGNLSPAGEAFTLALRGHWLGCKPMLATALPTFFVGLVATLLAILVRRRLRR